MTLSIPADFVTEKNKLTSTTPWIWLFECRVDADNAIRAASYTTNIGWPSGAPNTYYAYPIRFDAIAASGEGDTPFTTLTIPNANRELISYLRDNNGLTDKRVIVRLTHSSHLDETDVPSYPFDAITTDVDREAITFTLGMLQTSHIMIPHQQQNRSSCRHQFGTPESPCPYMKNATGAMYTTCPKTWEACEKRAADMSRLGQQVLIPRMWGGFRNIARPRN